MPPHDLGRLRDWVPGSGLLDVRPVAAGLVNRSFRVERDGAAYALRLTSASAPDLGQDRRWEFRVLKLADAAGLAPAVVHCDTVDGVLLSHWVQGATWSEDEARRPRSLVRIAQLMRRIHALTAPAPPRVMDARGWVSHYTAALARHRPASGAPRHHEDTSGALRERAAARLEALQQWPAVRPVLCHSDLHTLNIVDVQALVPVQPSLCVIDWEYAHVADPLWDVAGWCANNDFAAALQSELLTAYLGRPAQAAELSRLNIMLWLYDYVCLLWSELYLCLTPQAAPGVGLRARTLTQRLSAA